MSEKQARGDVEHLRERVRKLENTLLERNRRITEIEGQLFAHLSVPGGRVECFFFLLFFFVMIKSLCSYYGLFSRARRHPPPLPLRRLPLLRRRCHRHRPRLTHRSMMIVARGPAGDTLHSRALHSTHR